MARLTELRVKVCSMYGAVCLARLQRCSTRLVCVNKSICWSSVARMRVCVCSVERQEPNGGRRECAGELKILTATGSSKAPSLFLCCRFLSLSLCCKFLLLPPLFTSLSLSLRLHAFSRFLLRPQDRSITRRRANTS